MPTKTIGPESLDRQASRPRGESRCPAGQAEGLRRTVRAGLGRRHRRRRTQREVAGPSHPQRGGLGHVGRALFRAGEGRAALGRRADRHLQRFGPAGPQRSRIGDQWEREAIGERTATACSTRRARASTTGGWAPYGRRCRQAPSSALKRAQPGPLKKKLQHKQRDDPTDPGERWSPLRRRTEPPENEPVAEYPKRDKGK